MEFVAFATSFAAPAPGADLPAIVDTHVSKHALSGGAAVRITQ